MERSAAGLFNCEPSAPGGEARGPGSPAFAAASFSEQLARVLARTEYVLMKTASQREEVYRLRYEAFLREGAIARSASRRMYDVFDDMPNASVYAMYVDGELAGSIRLHLVATGSSSPALQAFPEVLEAYVARGDRILDPNRFVASSAFAGRLPALPYLLLRLPFLAAEFHGARHVTATVRREHQAFYRRTLLCRSVVEPRRYMDITKPISLMIADYPRVRRAVIARQPIFAPRAGEVERLFAASRELAPDDGRRRRLAVGAAPTRPN